MFGVFDGHGGQEVAKFVEKHLIVELKANEAFKKGDYRKALTEVFLKLDQMLLTDVGKKELAKYATKGPGG